MVKLLLITLLLGLDKMARAFTLNVPNVLLPLHVSNEMYTNFTLSADAGCFNWLSTKELVVGIRLIQSDDTSNSQECSREAQLTSLSQDPDRQLSLILAEETSTGSEMRVDVFVDKITRIAIKTTSLELLLEETPSTFEVVAYDEDGNTFSTLDGLQFTWTIEPDTPVTGSVLRHIPYSQSSYLTPPTIELLESQEKQGDKILIQGINTGVAWVKTKLSHPAYKSVVEVSVRVVVIENLLLNPPYDQWVLPLTLVEYKAERRQHGRKTEIRFPSDQYSLKLSNETVGEMSGPSTVTSLVIGDTDVILVDKNVQHLPLGTPPHTTVHVVPPEALLFKIKSDNWNFEKKKTYTFSITVLGPNNRPVLLTDNIRIQLSVEEEYLSIQDSNEQGTQHTVLAKETGSTKIGASLHTLIHPRTGDEHPVDPAVSNSQSVVIRLPVTVTPTTVILPLYKIQPYTFRLTGGGGSGQYTWLSRDMPHVGVNQEGVVTGRKEGSVGVTASDAKNPDNSATSQVIVAELSGLNFLPAKVETPVGTTLTLNLAAYIELEPGKKLPFTRCDMVPLEYSLSNELFVLENKEKPTGELVQGVCSVITVRGERPGFSILKVTYTTSQNSVLSATITIATYFPLTLTHPDHIPILTLGSSIVLELGGGPAPWLTAKSGYIQRLECPDEGCSSKLVPYKHTNIVTHHFRVSCLLLGVQSGLVVVGNRISQDNPFPAMESLSVAVRCEVPGLLELSHTLPLPPPECPHSDEVAVMVGRDVKIVYSVKTPDLLPFDNSSSLLFQFSSSEPSMISVDSSAVSGVEAGGADSMARLQHVTGSVTLTLSVSQYDEKYFADGSAPSLDLSLQQSLRFKLVNELSVSPSSLTMFNYEEGSRDLSVEGGSGSFVTTSDNESVVRMSSVDSTPITIRPHLQGAATLTIQDLCLSGQVARCNIHVTGPAVVHIKSVSQVQIHKSILLTLTIIDSNQRKISSEVFDKLDLEHQVSSIPHISLKPATDQSVCDQFCAVFQVEGISLGTSTVQFVVAGQAKILSNTLSITVFPPLSLIPSPLVLVEGAVFQLRYSGGPKYDSALQFTSPNHTTVLINQRALVTGVKVGKVGVKGSCVGVKSESDEVYSEASVSVEVIRLEGVEIRAPTTYVIEGAEIPLTVWGSDGNNPFTFASVTGITFIWKTSSSIVLLNSLYQESGYGVSDEKQFAVSASGVEQGVVMVTVVVTYQDSDGNALSHSDSISIQVIKKALLLAPSIPTNPALILGPGSTYHIRTNKDHTHTLHYTAISGSSTGVASLGNDGVVRAEQVGSTILRIEVMEDHNVNQTLLLHIQVKTPFSLLISESFAHPATSPDYTYFTLPVGLIASFSVATIDDLGRKFDSVAKTTYHYTLNRLDVVSVESIHSNSTLSLTGLSVGEAIVRIHSDNGLEGWVYIRVSSPLDIPVFTVLHKASVCISQLQDEEEGEWSSRDVSIATVQGTLVTGNGLGVTELRKQITSATHSIFKLEVVKVESVTLSPSAESRVLSNIPTSRTTSKLIIPVTMTTTKPLSSLPASCDTNEAVKVSFRCSSSHPGVVAVKPDAELGVCVVTALTNPVVGAVTPLITVHAGDSLTSSIKIPFVPRFQLSKEKVTLSPMEPTSDLVLLEGDFSLVQVLPDSRAENDVSVIKTSTHFHLALLNWNADAQHSFAFVCGATGQQEVVEVAITPSKPTSPSPVPIKLEFSTLASTLLPTALLGLLVLLIVLGIVFLTTASYRRLRAQPWGDSHTCEGTPPHHITMVTTPVKGGSPFRPATVSPVRLKTPLYTKPRGTAGTE